MKKKNKKTKLNVKRETIRSLGDVTQTAAVVGGLMRTYPPGECFKHTEDTNGNCPTATCTCTTTYD